MPLVGSFGVELEVQVTHAFISVDVDVAVAGFKGCGGFGLRVEVRR
jgi:hypothetical protein